MIRNITGALLVCCCSVALAQNAPSPGPTNPAPPNPQGKEGATIVINPTAEECKRGWDPSTKWTKEQFDRFCTSLGASK
jgi:hypothetical protein